MNNNEYIQEIEKKLLDLNTKISVLESSTLWTLPFSTDEIDTIIQSKIAIEMFHELFDRFDDDEETPITVYATGLIRDVINFASSEISEELFNDIPEDVLEEIDADIDGMIESEKLKMILSLGFQTTSNLFKGIKSFYNLLEMHNINDDDVGD